MKRSFIVKCKRRVMDRCLEKSKMANLVKMRFIEAMVRKEKEFLLNFYEHNSTNGIKKKALKLKAIEKGTKNTKDGSINTKLLTNIQKLIKLLYCRNTIIKHEADI